MGEDSNQNDQYANAVDAFGPSLTRLAKGYEADPELRRDLLQDIHVALWRSFVTFDNQCSLRTWVYRVAHSVVTVRPPPS
jgi:RNA polymerase sigma-70 factor (ECF subfamily)